MSTLAKPVIFETDENPGFLNTLETSIQAQVKQPDYLLKYPTVYIHGWKPVNGNPDGKYEIYIGESNDVIQRTREHYQNAYDPKKWQKYLLGGDGLPRMYVIGHPHFNKSLTLDIENRLMDYVLGMSSVQKVHNGRGNPQKNYFPSDEFEDIFSSIWAALRRKNKDLFLSESEIKDSAIFKASPLHKLTDEQEQAREAILLKVHKAIIEGKEKQLIFVQGEAGTGKTVLMSSLFYELLQESDELYEMESPLKCALMVNHEEQITVYKEIAKKLHLFDQYGDDIVCKPTHFINSTDPNHPIDVAFIDEGHLLLTQGKMSFTGKNQLRDIMDRAKVTVVMFDENQILTAEQYWEPEALAEIMGLAKEQDNIVTLTKQLRISCAPSTMEWIDAITKDHKIVPLAKDETGYEVRVFDDPAKLYQAIKEKASDENTRLSRLIASYDWEYSDNHKRDDGEPWEVKIGSFHLPWNRELEKTLTRKEKRAIKNLAWAEQPQTINEIGSTFTIQGFDLSFAGVIIGPSVQYRNGKIVFVPEKSWQKKAKVQRTLSNGSKKVLAEELLPHELRVLLTRGVNGLYIYACDPELQKALEESLKNK